MTFIMTLVALLIERFFHWNYFRRWRWFASYQRWLSHARVNQLSSWLLYLLTVLPWVLLVGFIGFCLKGWVYGVFNLLFGIVILLYCLGPANLWLQAYRCINQLNKEDPKAAIDCVQIEFGMSPAENNQAFHQAFTQAIFLNAYYHIFAVVFWFVILGPMGAVLYRATALLSAESPLGLTQIAKQIQLYLDWIPVRIFTFIFALGGHFVQVFASWKKYVLKRPETNETLLTECGIASLDVMLGNHIPEDGAAEKEAITLLDRVFVMGLVILAVGVLVV